MTESLDNILSGSGGAVPEQNTQVEEQVTQVAEGEGQQEQAEASEQGEQQQGGQKTVPHEALHAEKQKVKRYTEEVSSLRQEIADRDAAWERRIAQIIDAQKPKPEPQQPPDQFEDFTGAARHALMPDLQQYDSRIEAQNARWQKRSLREAERDHGKDIVKAAYSAANQWISSGAPEAAAFKKSLIEESDHPFEDMVAWFKGHQRSALVQDERVSSLLDKLNENPDIVDKLQLFLENPSQLQQGEGQQTQQRQATMPSNFATARNVANRSTGPAWAGPAPLQDIFKR
ncbi:hypothetical protein [Afipia clevelandensis]|uniref:Uncharacterized protein n=1 Tax=Afipia clevelandensis ATCC 49720 TaxID=883079 RepID=K8PDY0_9BRAD|nr:hypothetical protein [Afipia clevelandensis]EKS37765.1 hypothetical protein HMPREF9696_01715 [Afipia clevelandensis ATCC 49720]